MKMAVRTCLLEFQVPVVNIQNPVDSQTLQQDVKNLLGEFGLQTSHIATPALELTPGFLIQYFNKVGSYATLRGYPSGLITLDINEYVPQDKESRFKDFKLLEELERKIKNSIKAHKSLSLPAIERGAKVQCFYPSTDNKIIEYDFDECLYAAKSPYQDIKIMHSLQYGNVLILDNDVNLAESDIAYTKAITGNGRENFKDKSVLILGGGDGGILHELLQEHPKFMVMVDIDELVVEGAKKYLRGICHDSLDKLKAENYEVLIEDCVPVLEKYIQDGRLFDYVINDLTAIPVTTKPIGDQWDFLRQILDLSMRVLSPTGKYFTQGNGANMHSALHTYEDQLKKLYCQVDFKKETVCVPSYHEQWVFYEIWKTEETNEDSEK